MGLCALTRDCEKILNERRQQHAAVFQIAGTHPIKMYLQSQPIRSAEGGTSRSAIGPFKNRRKRGTLHLNASLESHGVWIGRRPRHLIADICFCTYTGV